MAEFILRFARRLLLFSDRLRTSLLVQWLKIGCAGFICGENLVLNGAPVFKFKAHANVVIGDGVTFNSRLTSNMVGLFKRCTVFVDDGAELRIGSGSGLSGVSIYCTTKIGIGNNIACGGNVSIWDTDFHSMDFVQRRDNINREKIKKSPITIGNDVFIGACSIILKGLTIGDRSIIGAGSVVTKSIPSDEIWAGNPARFIRKCDH